MMPQSPVVPVQSNCQFKAFSSIVGQEYNLPHSLNKFFTNLFHTSGCLHHLIPEKELVQSKKNSPPFSPFAHTQIFSNSYHYICNQYLPITIGPTPTLHNYSHINLSLLHFIPLFIFFIIFIRYTYNYSQNILNIKYNLYIK
jgi:hypothetical protein